MKNIIAIDTSDNKVIKVSIKIGEKEARIEQPLDHRKAQAVLPVIDDLLQKHHITLQDISEVEVNLGPGSFTGLRVGVAIANTLGTLLGIPVNGMKVGEMVTPIYT